MPTSTTTWRAGWRSCLIKLVLDEDGECDDDDYESITRSTHNRTKTSFFLVTMGAVRWFLGSRGPHGMPLIVSLFVLSQEKSDHLYMGMRAL